MRFFYAMVVFVALLGGLVSAGPAYAQGEAKESAFIPQCLLGAQIDANCDNVNVFIWLAINVGTYLFGFIGALALLFFVYGGFILIMSQGNQEKIKQGTGAMTAAIIGLVISFSAYALITFLSNTIGVKAEKRISWVETAYAQTEGDDVLTCTNTEGCWCASTIAGDCRAILNGDSCLGILSEDPCDQQQTIDPTLNNETVGTKPAEQPKGGISELKKGATNLNPMDIGSPSVLFTRGINLMMAFMGSIALVLYIFAGFIWMSASGNAERVDKAKRILVWTTLGALAMGASYMIIKTVLEKIG
ncbi:MAG: pilin [Patescibacteria group bacterium]|nr:pilin [Patescibacteria group bacterium]